jgi:hypothetical protein
MLLLGYIRPVMPIAILYQPILKGGIVHTVAGHGNYMSLALRALTILIYAEVSMRAKTDIGLLLYLAVHHSFSGVQFQ